MKKILLPLVALAFATPAAAQSIIVVTGPQADSTALPVAYAELRAGENHAAVAKLTGDTDLDARDPSRLQGREGVTVKALDAKDRAALQAAVAGVDAVLSAAHFATIDAHAIIEPVKRAGVKRLLVVGGAGSLLLPSGHRVIDSPDFPEAYKAEASAGVRFLEVLRQEPNLDWTFLSPPALLEPGTRSGKYRSQQSRPPGRQRLRPGRWQDAARL